MTAAGVILAAGAGSRFGGAKVMARIDGAPILAHVIAAARAAGLDPLFVVVAPDGPTQATALGLGPDEVVVNAEPQRGLSSSLRLGLGAAAAPGEPVDAAVVLLGDQPLVRPETIRALLDALAEGDRPVAAPLYVAGGGHNPVALARSAFGLAAEASGDRGLGPVLVAHRDSVREVPIDGDNPDIDTAGDLANVAERAWSDRVRRNREQVDRVREVPDGPDFYGHVSTLFREGPDRTGDAVLEVLLTHVRPGDVWLDIGAGAGRYALPVARRVREVIAIDPSATMLGLLREAMAEHAIGNVRVLEGRWPLDDVGSIAADVALIAHVGYDTEAIGPFVDAMERATRRTCLAVMMERTPASTAEPFWPPVHGESRVPLPAMPAFVDLLAARGRAPKVEIVDTSRRRWNSRDELERFVRRQLWTEPGSSKDRRMLELLDAWAVAADDGTVELSVVEPLSIGVVAWTPATAATRVVS